MKNDIVGVFGDWLSRRRGRTIRAEEFHLWCVSHGKCPSADWQRTMTRLITYGRKTGRLQSAGITRDKFHSYKTKWTVVA